MPMPNSFESLKKFHIALREVIVLVNRSRKEEEYRKISNIYLKSALILLASKFEAFLENTVEEYVSHINEDLLKEQIPVIIKIHHIKEFVSKLSELYKNTKDAVKRKQIEEYMDELSLVWQNSNKAKPIRISNKFNFGKHGQEAVNELFRRIGFDNILDSIVITEEIKTIDGILKEKVDFIAKVNELTNKRNSIIHNDISITFTKEEIITDIKYLKQFSIRLINKLNKSLKECKEFT